jgi:putative transposase
VENYPVQMMCRILNVSRSGYYAWLLRPVSSRQIRKDQVIEQIERAFAGNRQLYGSPRVHAELAGLKVQVSVNTVAKYMREKQLRGQTHRRFVVRTTDSSHAHPIAENLLEREFEQERPNQVWAVDITCIPTEQGWLYMAGVIDLCTRKIVGWAMADHMRTELCEEALNMAIGRQKPGKQLMHHSDRGCQYCSAVYRELLEKNGMICSMSGKGDCYDNAMMESFWSTLKRELVYLENYETQQQAKASIFEYIEVFYNRKRKHSSLGYLSPEQFEATVN